MTTITRTFDDAEWQLVPRITTREMDIGISWGGYTTQEKWTAALAAAPQPPEEGWLDISTAPKDGTRILLARCGLNEAGEDFGIWWACAGSWSARWKNWNDGIEPCGLADPNYWMPLPAPPKPIKEGVET